MNIQSRSATVRCAVHDIEARRVTVAGVTVERRVCVRCGHEASRKIIDSASDCNDAVRLMAILGGAEVDEALPRRPNRA